jgi:hypothetical protein
LNLQGEDGDPGEDGASATVTVGTVTTGAAGSSAAVTNVGTPSAAVLDFTIPRGATGATGGYTSGPGYGAAVDITGTAVNTSTNLINLPYPDANFTVTLDRASASEDEFFQLVMPSLTSIQGAAAHWVRVTFTIQHKRRVVGWQPWAPGELARAQGGLNMRGRVITPGSEPGAVSTIDYQWDVAAQCWYAVDGWGDVDVRHHRSLANTTRASSAELGLSVYLGPELDNASGPSATTSATLVTNNIAALRAVPIHVRRTVARRGVHIDLGSDVEDTIYAAATSAPGVDLAAAASALGFYSDGYRIVAAGADPSALPSVLSGFTMLHELGHAVDYQYYPGLATLYSDGILSDSPWLGIVYGRTVSKISDEPAVVAAWNTSKAAGIWSHVSNSCLEWTAQALALYWSTLVPGYSTSGWNTEWNSSVKSASAWDAFLDFLDEVRLTSALGWS